MSGLNSGIINSGVVAVLTATVAPGASGSAAIPIGNLVGAYPDGTFATTIGSGGTISINSVTPAVSTLQCSPASLASNGTANCTVGLTAVAPVGGLTVALSSNNSVLMQPPFVTVAAGVTTATFTASAGTITANQTATLTASLNGSVQTVITLVPPSPTNFTPIFIDAGGYSYTDSSGNVWAADYDYIGGNTALTDATISGTTASPLYQSGRWGSFFYQIPVPNGNYTVTLKFAEIYFTSAGSRIFNVSINGTPVLTNFDIVANAGAPFKAIDQSFPVTVTNGQIGIQFTPGPADQPMVNAIEIVSAGSSPPSPPSGGTPMFLTDAGGGAYTDSSGNVWAADYNYIGGSTALTDATISGTTASPLYQTGRWGSFSYQIPVPNGNYTVTLKFAEIYFTSAGSRIFNVSINGTPVLTNFDIVANAGAPFKAIDQSFPVTVTNGQIDIQFTPGPADQPMVNAIEVLTAN